jgi:hypothetical protein
MTSRASQPIAGSSLCDVYVDESSQTQHRYMLLGGLIVPEEVSRDVAAALGAARLPELPFGEIGWTKVSNSKLVAYQRFVDVALNGKLPVIFHVLIIDTHRIKDTAFNAGSREIGFNKEIYQLILKCWRNHKARRFHIYLDRRNVTKAGNPSIDAQLSLSRLRDIVNFGIHKEKRAADWPIRRIHYRDSNRCDFMQVADVLLGAIGFHVNGHRQRPNASSAKSALSDHILAAAGIGDVMRDTARWGRVTIWHRQMR